MTYSKPEITIVTCAIAAVRGSMDKRWPVYLDHDVSQGYNATSAAYEADE